jgi:hypothetical protein
MAAIHAERAQLHRELNALIASGQSALATGATPAAFAAVQRVAQLNGAISALTRELRQPQAAR